MRKFILLFFILNTFTITIPSQSQWTQLTGYPVSSAQDIVIVNGVFYVCSINNGVHCSTDNGVTWEPRNNNLINADSKRVYDMDFLSDKLFIATVDGIYISTNTGEYWERKSNGLTIGPGANNVLAFSIFKSDGNCFTGTYNGIYRSTNEGNNWNITSVSGQGIVVVSFTKFNGALYAGRDAINFPPMYKSTDNGLNWSDVLVWNNFPLGGFCYFAEGDTLFSGTGHGMWLTTNNGANWSSRNNGLSPDPYVSSIVKASNTMIASLKFGGSGVFKSINNGNNWIEISDNLPFINEISKLILHNNYIYAGTSEGMWKRPLSEIIVNLNEQTNSTPKDFSLEQNYPNPFNPTTIINYELRITSFVELKVYDVLGNEIATLVNEGKNAGSYEVEFDGSNLSSGIYFYNLFANGIEIDTKRMILLK